MGEGHAGLVGPGLDEVGEFQQQGTKSLLKQRESLALAQYLDVVLHVHAGCAQVDDTAAHGALFGVGAHLRHQVVLDLRLDCGGAGQIHLVGVSVQVGELVGADQARGVLGRRQGHPEPPPELPPVGLGPDAAQFLAPVAPGEGGEVGLVGEGLHQRTMSCSRSGPTET